MQLTRLAEDYQKVKASGAELVAISADEQAFAWSMGQTTGAEYLILADSKRDVIRLYGVLNAEERGGIAHPATFIIDGGGVVRFAHIGQDGGDRTPDEVILQELGKLGRTGG